ncbi:MAG: M23 family metallopeptidase [Bacteroidales bacterium]|nr:M23 family metallopeptidase [Bacteroidales bacterium]
MLNTLKFFLVVSFLSATFLLLLNLSLGSPNELRIKSQLSAYNGQLQILNYRIDSLQQYLHNRLYRSDKFYREILEADSLPIHVRIAGTGGSTPQVNFLSPSDADLILISKNKIDRLKKQVFIHEKSLAELEEKALVFNRETRYIPAIQPVKPTKDIYLSSDFGVRFDPLSSLIKPHYGIDLAGKINTEIFATADGLVTIADDTHNGYGKEIVILHEFGYSTIYAHLNNILVTPGQKVLRGQLIGLMGNTGKSTGVHLHYEVRHNNKPVNPVYYFADELSETDYEKIIKKL